MEARLRAQAPPAARAVKRHLRAQALPIAHEVKRQPQAKVQPRARALIKAHAVKRQIMTTTLVLLPHRLQTTLRQTAVLHINSIFNSIPCWRKNTLPSKSRFRS